MRLQVLYLTALKAPTLLAQADERTGVAPHLYKVSAEDADAAVKAKEARDEHEGHQVAARIAGPGA